jgi:hypothetical protein
MLKYLNGLNYKTNNIMNDYEMTELGKVKLKLPPVVKKATQTALSKLPPKAQATVNKITTQIKKAGANIKDATKKMNLATIPLAPSRTAFLGLVRLNALKLANKIVEAETKSPGKVQSLWKKLGGDWNVLKNTVNAGSKAGKLSGLGDPTVATAIASATPILVAVTKLLKELNIASGKELEQGVEQGKADLESNPDVYKTAGVDVAEGSSGVTVSRPTSEASTTETSTTETTETKKNMLPILIGAGALGVFLLMKKK